MLDQNWRRSEQVVKEQWHSGDEYRPILVQGDSTRVR
ncbi:unnamed protein product [Tuber aestivum]|uniref:Uncharacterized protein n=1 Tax=Tuber aestivum TaxID=59557 RepID=A0A292PLX4_9PEZI|nr:unnamed protein product [Tuber aestivum]